MNFEPCASSLRRLAGNGGFCRAASGWSLSRGSCELLEASPGSPVDGVGAGGSGGAIEGVGGDGGRGEAGGGLSSYLSEAT